MRVLVLGGTRFIGYAIVRGLIDSGMDVLLCHRGRTEPRSFAELRHLHVDRSQLRTAREDIVRFAPDAVVDCYAGGRTDTTEVLAALPDTDLRLVVLSSADVYRAYESLHRDRATDAVPLDERAPVRSELYPYRWQFPDQPELADYEKLEAEELYLARGGTVLRLAGVYGERDYARREWFVLRRVVAGRRQIPLGQGTLLFSRVYVRDVAEATRLVLTSERTKGEIFNVSERTTPSIRLLAQQILDAAGSSAELVQVPDHALPNDLRITRAASQCLLLDSSMLRSIASWCDSDPAEALRRTVTWHLEHAPDDVGNFEADDVALAMSA